MTPIERRAERAARAAVRRDPMKDFEAARGSFLRAFTTLAGERPTGRSMRGT